MGQRHSKSHKSHAEGSLTKYKKLKGRITRDPATLTRRRNTKEDTNPTESKVHCTILTASAAENNHTASSLTNLSVPILLRILHFLDPISQEYLRRTCHSLYHIPEPSVTNPFADPEDLFADTATGEDMEPKPSSQYQIGSKSRAQSYDHSHLAPFERDSFCHTCRTTRDSPAYADRVKKATKILHCSRCKADHTRCLFSKLQRDSTKIPESIRYCIGHEGVLRLCEHKAVSWLQIVNMSKEILKHKVGRRWKIVSCHHEDHLSSSSDGNGDSDSGNKKGSLGRLIENMRGKECPTLTVGFKDSTKDFCLALKWKGHITLDARPSSKTAGDASASVAEADSMLKELGEKLKELREAQGKYICPEPEPGLKVEEMVLAGLMADRCGGLNPDHGKERRSIGKAPTEPQKNLRKREAPSKVGATTEIESVRSSLSSTPLTHLPPTAEEDTDTDGSVDMPIKMKSLLIKHGKLAGSAKVTWGLGLDSGAEWVPVVTDPPTKVGDDVHSRQKKQDQRDIHAHHHHEHDISHRYAITDKFKIKPCRASELKKRKIIRDICHENKDEICLKVKYSRRVYIGDGIRGATVRDFVGFQNWISVLNPESYKLTEDIEGFGVYWCRGNLDMDEGLDHREESNNKRRATVSMNLDSGASLDMDKAKCRNYYRYIKSRTEGLRLAAGDYTRSCKKGSDERQVAKG